VSFRARGLLDHETLHEFTDDVRVNAPRRYINFRAAQCVPLFEH
jgi:hypothetical protein